MGTALLVGAGLSLVAGAANGYQQNRNAQKARDEQNKVIKQQAKLAREAAPTVSASDNKTENNAARKALQRGVASTILTSPLGVSATNSGKTKLGL